MNAKFQSALSALRSSQLVLLSVLVGAFALTGCEKPTKPVVMTTQELKRLEQALDLNDRVEATKKLLKATRTGDYSGVNEAMKARADVNGIDAETGMTPLALAASRGDKTLVKLFLDGGGASINQKLHGTKDKQVDGFTALHMAAMFGQAEAAQLLISCGADVEVKSGNGWTALETAITAQKQEVVDVLKIAGANKLAKKSQERSLENWLNDVIYVSEDFAFVFTALKKQGGAQVAGVFIDEKLNSKFAKWSLEDKLYARAKLVSVLKLLKRGDPEADQLIMAEDADPALKQAQKVLAFDRLMQIIKARAGHDFAQGRGNLAQGERKFMQSCLTDGADLNGQEAKTGMTPLMHASIRDDEMMIEWLCKSGANINQKLDGKNSRVIGGFSPLHMAALLGKPWATEVLIKNGANKDAKDDMGYTALRIAFLASNHEVVAIMKAAGAKE